MNPSLVVEIAKITYLYALIYINHMAPNYEKGFGVL